MAPQVDVPGVPARLAELQARRKSNPHPLQDRAKLLSSVRLLDVKNFQKLASPLPRSQDLPGEYFGVPSSSDDEVISVSHAWRNQAHPDPTCYKSRLLGQLLSQISTASSRNLSHPPSFFLFLDFVSIPQRPFRPGQEERTAAEKKVFKRALECMHEMYFYSDRIIHLPWEDVDVPGEGVEDTLPAAALKGYRFLEIGESVHVSLASQPGLAVCREPSMMARVQQRKERRPSLFDQVVSVDGEAIKSSAQLTSLLAHNAQSAKVRSYPFGKYSVIPADERGWVFLERFITMVKCAMMDEDLARQVVITPSESILQQIMTGAAMLREASLQEKSHNKHGELKRVLESFTEELEGKKFSAASTDKRELSRSVSRIDDRSVVGTIMAGFVEHLAEHWEAEADRQRSFGSRLTAVVAVAENYLVEWESFSEEYSVKMEAAAAGNPWPVVVLVALPLVISALPLLWPYASANESWDSQWAFWGVGNPAVTYTCFMSFATFLANTSKTLYSRSTLLFHLMWTTLNFIISSSISLAFAIVLDVFPVPLISFIGSAVLGTTAPALWFSAPRDQRASRHFWNRLQVSMVGLQSILGLYGIFIPLLNSAIPHVSEGWQPLLVSCYLVLKLLFEFLGLKLTKVLGADAMPHFVFVATFVYQLNLCIAFSKGNSWVLVVEQICFDVLENCYHLYSLFRQDSALGGGGGGGGAGRREQYIVASLALREFVEMVAPASFLVLHELTRALRPENFTLFCDRSEQEVQQTVYFLLVAIVVEFIGSAVTYVILRYRRHSPLRLLRGLIATLLGNFVLIAATSLTYYVVMQHSHWGMDLSFTFLWILEPDAEWRCGLTWEVPAEVA